MRLFAWKRAAEISADRVGILCAQSYEAALSALFKISSGISSALGGFDLTEYSKQLGELQNEIGNAEVDPSDWYTTHPFNPVRIRAAEFFWKSETYQELSGIQSHSIEFSEAALETSIAELLRIMEPAALSAGGEAGPILGTFFFWAALDLVLADEQVDEREVEALSTMVSPTPSAEVIAEFRSLTAEARWDRVVEWGQQASVHLSPKLRLAVIRDLSVLASSDGKLDEMELKTLRAHCRGLGVTEDFLITVLEELKKDLD
jgi:uncharacterized tellurite resistance protein B-like protein